jgi:hypothetical protein
MYIPRRGLTEFITEKEKKEYKIKKYDLLNFIINIS